MCSLFKVKPTVPKTVISASEIFSKFKIHNDGREDDWYFCAPIEDVMDWCYACRSECPPYSYNTQTEQGFDCDDFAKCFAAYCRRKNLSNAVWEAWGNHNGTGHAWNVCQCPNGLYEIEPQTGEVWVFGSNPAYKATLIK